MARRPFDPASFGWQRTRYVQGDILDRDAVDELVAGADVVVHLAFIIFGDAEETQSVNLEGSRNVFAATAAAGAQRLVYTSSVAAYGFHTDNPQPLDEDVPARGSESLYYSAQKAELERAMTEAMAERGDRDLRLPALDRRRTRLADPGRAPALRAGRGGAARRRTPGDRQAARPRHRSLPDFGVPLQLVHAEDVADALVAGVLGRGHQGSTTSLRPVRSPCPTSPARWAGAA